MENKEKHLATLSIAYRFIETAGKQAKMDVSQILNRLSSLREEIDEIDPEPVWDVSELSAILGEEPEAYQAPEKKKRGRPSKPKKEETSSVKESGLYEDDGSLLESGEGDEERLVSNPNETIPSKHTYFRNSFAGTINSSLKKKIEI